jgi:hypothetical protein
MKISCNNDAGHPALSMIRTMCRAYGAATLKGRKEFVKHHWGATLFSNVYGEPTSIQFRTQESYEQFLEDLDKFKYDSV